MKGKGIWQKRDLVFTSYQSYVVFLFAGDVDIIEPPGPSMTAAVGDTVELVCENDDQSTLEWSRDGMPLISGSHYSIRYVITYSFSHTSQKDFWSF